MCRVVLAVNKREKKMRQQGLVAKAWVARRNIFGEEFQLETARRRGEEMRISRAAATVWLPCCSTEKLIGAGVDDDALHRPDDGQQGDDEAEDIDGVQQPDH